jgi:hypothetical protein
MKPAAREPAQLSFPYPERIIEVPEYLPCPVHGDFPWELYYEDREMIQMIDEQGFIDCPECLAGIVGIE